MKDGPDIARVAALIGDPARANILAALMSGRALTPTELSIEAGVTKSTVSSHLSRLADGGLIRTQQQGRHRYVSLSDSRVAEVLEALMGLAQQTGAVRVRTGPKDAELRRARICYDHLAGEMGVRLLDGLLAKAVLVQAGDSIELTERGRAALPGFGIDIKALSAKRRPICRSCLDWSVRRPHLAGALGAAFWQHFQQAGWAVRDLQSRAIRFSAIGEKAFAERFGT